MTLSRRLERIEHKIAKSACSGPMVIIVHSAETDQPNFALVIGGGTIRRETGETPEFFYARTKSLVCMWAQAQKHTAFWLSRPI